MGLVVEEVLTSKKILFIFAAENELIKNLKKRLADYQIKIVSSSHLIKNLTDVEYLFIFDDKKILTYNSLRNLPENIKVLFFIFDQRDKIDEFRKSNIKNLQEIKLINLDKQLVNDEIIEKILWFAFSQTNERALDLERSLRFLSREKKERNDNLHFKLNKRKLLITFLLVFLFFEFFFILPVLTSGIFLYKSISSLLNYDLESSKKFANLAKPLVGLGKNTYKFSRPLISTFFLALPLDNLIDLEENALKLTIVSTDTIQNVQVAVRLLLKNDKSNTEIGEFKLRISNLKKHLSTLEALSSDVSKNLTYSQKGLKKIKNLLEQLQEALIQSKVFLGHIDQLAGDKSEKNYLLLFLNNMELRPGGGFIGSYGIVTFSNYTLKKLIVEDVYTADGQLKAHIEPPEAIAKYLEQPNWYLRDSNFSPDFAQNVKTAKFFLKKEVNIDRIDGAVGITTTAINLLLEGFGDLYLADYKETINKDNFYIKTQSEVEREFFPGSTAKKNFLSALVSTMILKLEDVSLVKLGKSIKKALDEKQIVLYFDNLDLQKNVDLYGYSGKIVLPICKREPANCINDNLALIEANLGVNKVNFFIKKLINLKVNIASDGQIANFLTVEFNNNSSFGSFLGGVYKNYFQIYLPRSASVQEMKIDNLIVKDYTVKPDRNFTIVSAYLEIPPQSKKILNLNYVLNKKIESGQNTYQLVVQKQIGAFNNDINIEFILPTNINLTYRNFASVAKENSLIYNTTLSTDKIFVMGIAKK